MWTFPSPFIALLTIFQVKLLFFRKQKQKEK